MYYLSMKKKSFIFNVLFKVKRLKFLNKNRTLITIKIKLSITLILLLF
jgi:hypothetical protein